VDKWKETDHCHHKFACDINPGLQAIVVGNIRIPSRNSRKRDFELKDPIPPGFPMIIKDGLGYGLRGAPTPELL
jgi:hypothetical protein